MSIPLTPVASSLARGIGYDAPTQTLAIEHHDKSVYHYHPVSAETHRRLMASKSKGSFIHDHIRGKVKHTQAK